ncbi:Replication protein A 32 kDa subunit A [Apostasia shenzhenica]|uniref:Replication protein A 32 kDa subunit A n=1 Tax=Apostasia shenzhenica TaxID=1088818 RepID=A0A2I0A782_9ASPA|nr:Replication protein A 32 kDa subunit A [Apostasia shenzhenica]
MAADQFSGASLLAGGALMASQSIDYSISPSKIRATQTLIPVTVKQLLEAYHYSEDKSAITVNGVEITNIRLVGLVVNKVERVTDVSFTIDDGTGRMDISRWANESSDSDEVASFQNGMYVKVHGHLRGFHGKRHALAFSVQPITDFNDVVLHYIECMHAHMVHIKLKQLSAHSNVDGLGNDVYNLVLRLFQEPAMLSREHGLHLDEVFRRLNFPKNMIMEAINCLVDVGHIYSTVDEYHFRSVRNF